MLGFFVIVAANASCWYGIGLKLVDAATTNVAARKIPAVIMSSALIGYGHTSRAALPIIVTVTGSTPSKSNVPPPKRHANADFPSSVRKGPCARLTFIYSCYNALLDLQ